ncbi:MAG: cytochrome c3 family protein [Bacillota bacterium]
MSMRRLPVFLLLLLLVLLGVGALSLSTGGAAGEAPPQAVLACAECHSMEREVATWAGSVHKDLTCLECHKEGDVTWVRHEFLERNDQMAAHARSEIHTIPLKTYNERCVTCHEEQLDALKQDRIPQPLPGAPAKPDAGQPMAIRALHDKHLNGKEPMDCVACHLDEVHGPAQGTEERRESAHRTCLECHEQKQVRLEVAEGDVSCAACHLEVEAITPEDHREARAWARAHGQASEVQNCGSCHLSASAGPHDSAVTNPASFQISQQDACLTCHAGLTMPHPASFVARHGQEALAAKEGTCEACHAPAEGEAAAPAHADPQFCSACHLQPMPHPDGYLGVHGAEALAAPATCEACHSNKNPVNATAPHASKTYCASCHNAYQHPRGWVAAHGSQVKESCATCHSVQQGEGGHNACAACHTSEGSWHEKMWFIKHGKQVKAEGDAACLNCHSEVEPSCSKCHSER